MSRPKVFVTRRIPEVGLRRIHEACDAEVWPEQLPPPYDLIKQKLADCDGPGVVAHGPHRRRTARRRPTAQGREQLRCRLQQHRRAGGDGSRRLRRQHARGADRSHGRLRVHAADRRGPPAGRGSARRPRRPMEDVGAGRVSGAGSARQDARRRRHGPHWCGGGEALPAAAGT